MLLGGSSLMDSFSFDSVTSVGSLSLGASSLSFSASEWRLIELCRLNKGDGRILSTIKSKSRRWAKSRRIWVSILSGRPVYAAMMPSAPKTISYLARFACVACLTRQHSTGTRPHSLPQWRDVSLLSDRVMKKRRSKRKGGIKPGCLHSSVVCPCCVETRQCREWALDWADARKLIPLTRGTF